jgi:hypothetical protein
MEDLCTAADAFTLTARFKQMGAAVRFTVPDAHLIELGLCRSRVCTLSDCDNIGQFLYNAKGILQFFLF